MIRWLIALPMLAGCIDIPDHPSKARCDDFPNSGTPLSQVQELNVHTATTGDLNADGCDDLVVLGLNGEVYVTYGRLAADQALIYHESITTQSEPVAIEVANVIGNDQPDIIVFGRAGGSGGLVEIFEAGIGVDGNQFKASTDVSFDPGFDPQSGSVLGDLPVSLVIGDFDGDGDSLDLAIADLGNLVIANLNGSDGTAVPEIIVPFDNSPNWSNIQQLFRYPIEGQAGDALMVVERDRVITRSPNGNLLRFPSAGPSNLTIETAQLHAIDEEEGLDLIGGSASQFGAYLKTSNSSFNLIETPQATLAAISSTMWQLSVLPTSSGNELVTFERVFDQVGVNQIVHRPLGFSNQQFSTQSGTVIGLPNGFNPISAVVADLDKDGVVEYRVISTDGKSQCFVPDKAGLKACGT